jgi:hypothetical protein
MESEYEEDGNTMIPLATPNAPAYDLRQVLVTPTQAEPRADIADFLSPPHWFTPMGDGPVRKAGHPSCVGLRTSPRPRLRKRG